MVNSRAHYETGNDDRIVIFYLKTSEIQKRARLSPKLGARFPEWGARFLELGALFPESGIRFAEWRTRFFKKRSLFEK